MDTVRYLTKLGLDKAVDNALDTTVWTEERCVVELARSWRRHPIVFRPTTQMLESMRHVDITIPPSDYSQPYDAILMDWPDGHCSLVGYINMDGTRKLIAVHRTDYGTIRGSLHMSLGIDGRLPSGEVVKQVEDILALPSDGSEERMHSDHLRAALNLCLLLSNHPLRRVRGERERLLQWQAKSKARRKALDAHEKLKLMPQVIEFVTEPRLYESFGAQTDITVQPHWRCGHWRNQACGPAWREHRLTFIHPMLIHRDRVDGDSNEITYLVA